MHAQTRRLLGVLGGMGPAATADFLAKLVKVTPAQRDQHHIPTVVCSVPQIPDRTDAILNGGPSPLPAMLRALRLLETSGASVLAIPCNTAHYWFDELQRRTALPIIHAVDATVEMLRMRGVCAGTLGLLATTATVAADVYANRLAMRGMRCIVPEPDEQARVMAVIRAVKSAGPDAGHAQVIYEIAASLIAKGAGSVILGCTELPLLVQAGHDRYVDATEALACACVREFHSAAESSDLAHLENTPEKCKAGS